MSRCSERSACLARSPAPRAAADPNAVQVERGEKNPWTSLKLNNDADQFQFAVVSDRTGGHRDKVFSRAMYQINLLQPQFVMTVGDLIEGYTTKEDVAKDEWTEFDGYLKKLEMPFFYTAGNHDLANKMQVTMWGERYGKRYYHFVYKNTLFLVLNSENPPDGINTIDTEQQEWVARTLAANAAVRWTFVFLHRPMWATAKDLEKSGWPAVEKALAGRKYNVFVGHVHRYMVYERNGTQYYQLATTGGDSKMRGVEYGEFDHIAWITMRKEGPVIVQVMLDGILPATGKLPDTDEKGYAVKKKPTQPVSGIVTVDGKAARNVTVCFYQQNPETKKYKGVADGLTDAAGRYKLSTYTAADGCPAGEYLMTVVDTGKGFSTNEIPEKNLLPEKYADPKATPLKIVVKEGANDINLDVSSR